jgi:hypothetical protein
MAVSNGDILKVFLELVLGDGTIAQNVFHMRADFTDDRSDTSVLSAVQGYLESIYDEIDTYLADDFTINPSWLNKVAWDPTSSKWLTTYLVGIFTPSFTHTNTDDPFPNQIAPVLVANTYAPKTRGRKFVMGFVESAADAGNLLTTPLADLAVAGSKYITPFEVVVGEELTPGVPDANSGTFHVFRSGSVNSIVGTQRRRKPGVGA